MRSSREMPSPTGMPGSGPRPRSALPRC
jgi:hypothetical protein